MNSFQFYSQVAKVAVWMLLNACYKVFQWLVWEVTGINYTLRRASLTPWFKEAAQVMKVRSRFKFCQYLSPASKWDFLLTHESFQRPEYVLQDHITLYSVVGGEAIFIESDPKVNVWSSKACSFSMVAQHDNALKVIRMPMETMHYLADKVGEPKGKLVFLSNCARCGSTLLNQMFEATNKIIAFAEPNCINFLSKLIDQKTDSNPYSEEVIRKTKSIIRLLCHIKAGKVDAYVMKICSPAMIALPFLKEMFPESTHLYLYREPVKVCQSIYRMSLSLYSINMIFRFGKNSAFWFSNMMAATGFPAFNYRVKVKHNLSISMVHWCVHMKMYLDLRQMNLKIAALRYEDIIEDPTNTMKKVFAYCDLPEELVAKTTIALSWDSQKDSLLDNKRLKTLPLLPYTGEVQEEGDAICQHFGFCRATEFQLIDFTITHPTISMKEVLKNK